MRNMMRTMLAATLLLAAPGCGITDPKPIIDEFSWEVLEDFTGFVEGFDVAGFFGDIAFASQLKTTTLCYTVDNKLETSGNALTVRVNLTSTNSPNCAQANGGFRYSGAIKNLSKGTYTLRIIQTVGNGPPTEYTETIVL